MEILDIGTVAERSGLPVSTLRYYEEQGLITSIGRHGLRRQFGAEVLAQLALISLGKMAGFSLEAITGMFGADGTPDLPRAELLARAEALDRQIRELGALSRALRHVAECPAPSHMECPSFRRMLKGVMRPKPAARVRRP